MKRLRNLGNRYAAPALLAWLAAAAGLAGCSRDVRLAGKKVRHVQARVVQHHGIELDESATPEEVVYVLLRAIHDDVNARTAAEREAAMDVQFDTCAPDGIVSAAPPSKATRDEALYLVVSHWAPALAYYADTFNVPFDKLRPRMTATSPRVGRSGDVACTVNVRTEDPSSDPRAAVNIIVSLVRVRPAGAAVGSGADSGDGSGLWRVLTVGFLPSVRPGTKLIRNAASVQAEAAAPVNGS